MVERGPIRPPSEFTSLLLRVTRHCPWNKCAFCSLYEGQRFQRRDAAEVVAEIGQVAHIASLLRERASAAVAAGRAFPLALLDLVSTRTLSYDERRVALWLSRGGTHVFLQDADSLVGPAHHLLPILEAIRTQLPTVQRITTYARSRSLFAKSLADLTALRSAGLSRVHVGIESGSAAVLSQMAKGCLPAHHIEGGRKAIAAGLEMTAYIMPGLGGVALRQEHVAETAHVLQQMCPHHIRVRTLWIDEGTRLARMRDAGEFQLPEEEDMLAEIRDWLVRLRGMDSEWISDHDRNLLPRLRGHLTRDFDALFQAVSAVLDLPLSEQHAFIVARRLGMVATLETFLEDEERRALCRQKAAELVALGEGSLVRGMALGLRARSI
ncbi:MAG: radical SAM protein [Myxococcales bacterium]|nr:radical SAM protein [Myxococcales bacterium]